MESHPWWQTLDARAWKVYSQDGEEGIVEAIFRGIGQPTEAPSDRERVCLDVGAGDGWNLSNTRFLAERGWRAVMLDAKEPPSAGVHLCRITRENINEILNHLRVPIDLDFLSLDIDGVDHHVWEAMDRRPRVAVFEFNGIHPRGRSVRVPYDPEFRFNGTDFYGASLDAFEKLGRLKGYALVHQRHGVNAFFVRRDLLPPGCDPVVHHEPKQYHAPDPAGRVWQEY